MKIIESFVEGKLNIPEKCEDALVATDNYACVIDGATSKFEITYDGKTSGRLASEIISSTVKNLSIDIGWNEIIKIISEELNNYYKKKNIYDFINENPGARAQATIAIYSEKLKEVCIVADSQCMIDGQLYYNYLKMDDVRVNARALFLEGELRKGKTVEELLENDTGAQYINPLLNIQCLFNNNPGSQYSYGVIDGQEIPEEEIKILKVPDGTKNIILATDGYPVLKSTLKETEAELKRIIAEDPLCIGKYKQFRGISKGLVSFDDRAYLKIEL